MKNLNTPYGPNVRVAKIPRVEYDVAAKAFGSLRNLSRFCGLKPSSLGAAKSIGSSKYLALRNAYIVAQEFPHLVEWVDAHDPEDGIYESNQKTEK